MQLAQARLMSAAYQAAGSPVNSASADADPFTISAPDGHPGGTGSLL